MNILHHKSWHVRNRNNIERVRRDERNAAAQQAEKERRALFAEREARIAVLRKRAQLTEDDNEFDSSNIFDNTVSEDKGELKPNVEHEREKKKEKEEWEKKVGILTYLGQSELGSCDKPWYLKSHESRMKLTNPNATHDECDVESKSLNDPLNDMKRYLEIMKSNKHESERKLMHKHSRRVSIPERREKRKSKHKQKETGETSKDVIKTEVSEKESKLEKLRTERIKREEIEKERQRQLFKRLKPIATPEVSTPGDRRRNYNYQFNPHLAKQNH